MLAVYIACVVLAGALTGVYAYELLSAEGYVADFESGVLAAGGAACVYIALQFLYLSLVTLFVPTRDRSAFGMECLSQGAVLLLLPYLMDMAMDWPYAFLETFAPLVYLTAFALVHVAFKFLSFFAFTSGRPTARWPSAVWLAVCLSCVYIAFLTFQAWATAMESARPQATADAHPHRVGDVFARATELPEGALFTYSLSGRDSAGLTLRWALPAERRDDFEADTVNVVMYFDGENRDRIAERVELRSDGWAEQRLRADEIPEGADRVSLFWSVRDEPPWQRLLGFQPVVTTSRELLLSGPFNHETRADASSPNIIVISVDGLGWANMSLARSDRETTPALDRLASTLQYFPFTYSPAPEPMASNMTLLTGVRPLRHQYRDGETGTIPSSVAPIAERFRENGYTTAAFTEGEALQHEDLVFGSGFERGFEWFDPSYEFASQPVDIDSADRDVDPDVGSRRTLNKARKWIDNHSDVKFMVYVRLRELGEFQMRPAYGTEFISEDREPAPRDIYDSALLYLDRQIASFVKYIRDYETRKNTVIIITGAFGYEFTRGSGEPFVGLTEETLRVPLIMYIPNHRRVERNDLVGLEDVPLAALALGGIEAGPLLDGREFLSGPTGNEPIAVLGSPPALSIRTTQWRFSWAPTSDDGEAGGIVELYDMTRYRPGRELRNLASRNPAVVRRQQERLSAYLASAPSESAAASLSP